jgi:hypothetical protein
VSYLAWLNTAPEAQSTNGKAQPKAQATRRAQIESAGMEPIVPPVERGEHLIGYLFEFGPVGANGPLTAGEVLDIGRVLAVDFDPWESRLLVRLSREYQGQLHVATNPGAKCPIPELAWQWRRAQVIHSERNLDAFCK